MGVVEQMPAAITRRCRRCRLSPGPPPAPIMRSETSPALLLDLARTDFAISRVVAQEALGVLAALADALAVIGGLRARLLDHPRPGRRDRAARRSFEMPSPYMMSNSTARNGGAILFFTTLTRVWLPVTVSRVLDRADAADVEPDRGVELQRVAAGRRLRVAEHHADLTLQGTTRSLATYIYGLEGLRVLECNLI